MAAHKVGQVAGVAGGGLGLFQVNEVELRRSHVPACCIEPDTGVVLSKQTNVNSFVRNDAG